MNNQTVIEQALPSGRKVKITISEDGTVIVQGAAKVNAIYGFDIGRLPAFCPPALENDHGDYVAVHTEWNSDSGVTAEFSAIIDGETMWWSPGERAGMRLSPLGLKTPVPFFKFQLKEPDEMTFRETGRKLPFKINQAA